MLQLIEIGWGAATCLSVNFPGLPAAAVGPLTLARQGAGTVQGMEVEARTDPRGLTYYWVGFRRGERDQGPESDIEALNAGRIVVTPLRYDRTDEAAYAALSRVRVSRPRFRNGAAQKSGARDRTARPAANAESRCRARGRRPATPAGSRQ